MTKLCIFEPHFSFSRLENSLSLPMPSQQVFSFRRQRLPRHQQSQASTNPRHARHPLTFSHCMHFPRRIIALRKPKYPRTHLRQPLYVFLQPTHPAIKRSSNAASRGYALKLLVFPNHSPALARGSGERSARRSNSLIFRFPSSVRARSDNSD